MNIKFISILCKVTLCIPVTIMVGHPMKSNYKRENSNSINWDFLGSSLLPINPQLKTFNDLTNKFVPILILNLGVLTMLQSGSIYGIFCWYHSIKL